MKGSQVIDVRPLCKADWEAFVAIQDQFYSDDLLRVGRPGFLEKLRICPEYVFGAFDRDVLLGYCILKDRPFRPWTSGDFLAVAREHQGRGVARPLIRNCFEISKRPFFRIFVRPSNHLAHQLYLRMGFRKIGIRKNNYTDGEDAIIMMKYVWNIAPTKHRSQPQHAIGETPQADFRL